MKAALAVASLAVLGIAQAQQPELRPARVRSSAITPSCSAISQSRCGDGQNPARKSALSFASANARATADASGRWDAELAAMPAGGPYVLTARTDGRRHRDLRTT